MDAAGYAKHIIEADMHTGEAVEILDQGVQEEISEDVALLCADTQLMLAIFRLEDARREIAKRRRNIKLEGGYLCG